MSGFIFASLSRGRYENNELVVSLLSLLRHCAGWYVLVPRANIIGVLQLMVRYFVGITILFLQRAILLVATGLKGIHSPD